MKVLFLICLWLVVIMVARGQFREYRAEYEAWRLKRLTQKKTEYMARAWENIARSYDPETEPEKRGLAVARAANLRHELQKMREE